MLKRWGGICLESRKRAELKNVFLEEFLRYTISILVSVSLGIILLYFEGENLRELIPEIGRIIFTTRSGIANSLRWASPVIITGLAVAIGFRAGVGNIGVEGQLYVGALVSAIAGYSLASLSSFSILFKFVLMLLAMISGAIYALIPGMLLIFLNINEILSTMMFNYVAIWGTEYIVKTFLMEAQSAVPRLIATREILSEAYLSRLMPPYQLNLSLIIGIVLCIVFYILYKNTVIGYEFETTGHNKLFALQGGINPIRTTLLAFAISGGIGGLAGATEVMGIHHKFINGFSSGLGWDGLLVAMIARNNPLGVIAAGIFWGFLKNTGLTLERISDVSRWVVYLVQAFVVLLITAKIDPFSVWKGIKAKR